MSFDTYTDAGRLLIAEAVLPLLTHLAVGDGATPGQEADPTATALIHEIARVRYLQRYWLVADENGPIVYEGARYSQSPTPTRLAFLRFRFEDAEALGQWSELGLFGGGITYVPGGTVLSDATSNDDLANVDVVLAGTWAPEEAGSILVLVSTGGASGVAQVQWASTVGAVPSDYVGTIVEFGVPLTIPGSGLTLTFSGGGDNALTYFNAWTIDATLGTSRPEYAEGGVYDGTNNPGGQVVSPGTLFRVTHLDPPSTKDEVSIDVQLVVEVIRG